MNRQRFNRKKELQTAQGEADRINAHDGDYVFGTYKAEIERLGLQHRVWRPRTSDAWRRAGFTAGQTLIDLGCGPGFTTLDLAEIVGPSGHVAAIDRSSDFLQIVQREAKARHIQHISTYRADLDRDDFPAVVADGAYGRWVFGFLTKPRDLLVRVAKSLKPHGTLVIQEYFDYETLGPTIASPSVDAFVQAVLNAWRAEGGEPNVGRNLLQWLDELDFEIISLRPIVDLVLPDNYIWQWPKSFFELAPQRLIDLGFFSEDQAEQMRNEFAEIERRGNIHIVTPALLEIIARKRR